MASIYYHVWRSRKFVFFFFVEILFWWQFHGNLAQEALHCPSPVCLLTIYKRMPEPKRFHLLVILIKVLRFQWNAYTHMIREYGWPGMMRQYFRWLRIVVIYMPINGSKKWRKNNKSYNTLWKLFEYYFEMLIRWNSVRTNEKIYLLVRVIKHMLSGDGESQRMRRNEKKRQTHTFGIDWCV